MISIVSFLHTCFIRSYRYGPPAFIFFIGIIFVYSVVPNPIMESYAFSSAFLFIVSTIICYILIDIETANQEAITMLHSRSLLKLYLAKLLYSWIFTIPLALYAVLFPAIFHKFDRNPTFDELMMSFLYHTALSWLGISLACWFTSKLIRSRLISFLMLSVFVVITFCVRAIENLLPENLKPIIVLLPPLDKTINVLMNYHTATSFMKFSVIGASLIYGIILNALFLILLNKRKLDSPQE
ncbi:hypothetical protein [Paenibacillus radicis (ex Gao et al. 2016)]|uniref:hypothetical protein n=1 Tax=Paenibacillus radicis (ex Gao et al. 2016) TaxID=1737354 RepID=UPI00166DDA90|nr:hypothetical protein [Paenibacillus radicis (ex Gao et al. 2016)]